MGGVRLWLALLLLPITSVFWTAYHLASNYIIACRVGIPVVVVPVNPESPLWMLTSDYLGPYIDRVLSWIPFGSGSFTRYAHRGWDIHDRAKTFLELGDAFVLVTTGKNWLFVCNAEALAELLQRRNDFKRPLEIMAVLDVFGPNLSTVEGKDWQRHRKATGPPFGEPNMGLVWTECISQAKEMLQYWENFPDIRRTGKDVRRFSLHVLSATGFGKSYPYSPDAEEETGEGSLTYKESLHLILENAILLMLLGPKLLTGSLKRCLPKHWALVGQATNTFKSHIANTIKEEKRQIAEGKVNSGNFIGAMVRASEEAAAVEEKNSKIDGYRSNLGLTESEIYGNIFVFNFAGHDSIAITLTYMITHLAAHPEIQNWIAEEIRQVCNDHQEGATVSYRDAFPRLKRCTAIVYETLRTSTPFPAIVKSTGSAPRSIEIGGKPLLLPAGMNIICTFSSIHSHPRYWGNDADAWRPGRWIKAAYLPDRKSSSVFDQEFLWDPPRGAFLPWADGERGCPGKKFAQVELVGALSALFAGGWRVEPVLESEGESQEAARERLQAMIKDSGMVLLVEMLHPEKVGLRWVKK